MGGAVEGEKEGGGGGLFEGLGKKELRKLCAARGIAFEGLKRTAMRKALRKHDKARAKEAADAEEDEEEKEDEEEGGEEEEKAPKSKPKAEASAGKKRKRDGSGEGGDGAAKAKDFGIKLSSSGAREIDTSRDLKEQAIEAILVRWEHSGLVRPAHALVAPRRRCA